MCPRRLPRPRGSTVSSVLAATGVTTIADDYSLGLDGALNRLSGRKRNGSWLFRESYEGAGRLSGRRLGADGVGDLRWSATPDRFGRVRDLFTLDAWHRVVETRHVGAGSPSTLTFINVLDAARAVEFIDGQAAIFAVIGDGRTWAYSFARNTWAPVPLETDSEMGFASSYAQVVYSARCGVLVNVGAQSRGTAVMRPDLGKIEWE